MTRPYDVSRKWLDIKRNELNTSHIPYEKFDEKLDNLIVWASMIGWDVHCSHSEVYSRSLIQFNVHGKWIQININIVNYNIIDYENNHNKLRHVELSHEGNYDTNFTQDAIKLFDNSYHYRAIGTEEFDQLFELGLKLANLIDA